MELMKGFRICDGLRCSANSKQGIVRQFVVTPTPPFVQDLCDECYDKLTPTYKELFEGEPFFKVPPSEHIDDIPRRPVRRQSAKVGYYGEYPGERRVVSPPPKKKKKKAVKKRRKKKKKKKKKRPVAVDRVERETDNEAECDSGFVTSGDW